MYARNPLKKMPYAQAAVLTFDDGTRQLQSYATIVAEVDPDGWVYINGLYSATTRKHLGAFMAEIADLDYHLAKTLYLNGERYNIYTGEVEKF